MRLKKLLADAFFLNAKEYHYRSCGYDAVSAYALASRDLRQQGGSGSNSAASRATMERLENSRAHYNETMAALVEQQRKRREENPWIYEEAEKFRQEAIRIQEESKKKNG